MSLSLRLLSRAVPPVLLWPTAAAEVGLTGTRATQCERTPLGWSIALRLNAPTTVQAVASPCGRARRRVRDGGRTGRWGSTSRRSRPSGPPPAPIRGARSSFRPINEPCGCPPMREARSPSALTGKAPKSPFHSSEAASSSAAARDPGSPPRCVPCSPACPDIATPLYSAIDPKRVELAPWRQRFTSLVVGSDARLAIDLLAWLVDEVQRRAARMEQQGIVSAPPGPEFPALVLVIDEWAELAAAGSQKERSQAQDLLRRFVSLGRAVGGSAILATQRPTSDTVDVGTRALLTHRLALRCGDKWQSEAILGQGNDDDARIPVSSPGWGLLNTDQGLCRIQVYSLAPDRIPEYMCPVLRVEPW